ncbi:MAG: hypothetical protein KME42_24800 [Tildeniella nuda ZEHNDER 1965/U140]|nr:hypothetical protein [Tildeniella nuda ZEHNDER 1965/U140]
MRLIILLTLFGQYPALDWRVRPLGGFPHVDEQTEKEERGTIIFLFLLLVQREHRKGVRGDRCGEWT